MKALTIASLLLSASALATLANAQSGLFCNQGEVISGDSEIKFNSGSTLVGDRCTLASSKKLSLGKPESTADNGPAVMSLEGWNVQQGGALWYFMTGDLSAHPAFHLTIKDCNFERNAGIVFQGNFPRNSIIVVSGNVYVGTTSANPLYGLLGAYCVLFYESNRMESGSSIKISQNTMVVALSSSTTLANGVLMNSQFTMAENARFEVSHNSVDITSASTSFPAGIGMASTSASMSIAGENTQFIVTDNDIRARNQALGLYLPVHNTGGRQGLYNVSNNRISIESAGVYNIRVRGLNFAKSSVVDISGNTMTSLNTDCRMMLTDVNLAGNTVFNVTRNYLSANNGNVAISFQNTATVRENARMTIDDNEIYRVDAGAPGVPSIHFLDRAVFTQNSFLSVSNNTVDSVGRPAHFLLLANTAADIAATATVVVCNNQFYGSPFTDYSHYMSAGFVNAMRDPSMCPTAMTPSTTTTTTTTSTTTTTTAAPTTAATVTSIVTEPVVDVNATTVDDVSVTSIETTSDEGSNTTSGTTNPAASTTGGSSTPTALPTVSTTVYQNGAAGASAAIGAVVAAVAMSVLQLML